MDKVAGMATQGIQDSTKGLGEMLAAPLQKFNKGDKEDKKETQQSAAPIIINVINQAKGDEDKQVNAAGGASASASASSY
ncbi:MAG: hypothetical protein AB9903_15855 [Vulcanimicrobiota bacterium]